MTSRLLQSLDEYDRLMYRTAWLSKMGVLFAIVIAVVEAIRGLYFLYLVLPAPIDSLEAVIRTESLRVLIIVGLGIRFFVLFRRVESRRWLSYLSWFAAFLPCFWYFAEFKDYWRPKLFEVYSFYNDPLEGLWISYLFWSVLRIYWYVTRSDISFPMTAVVPILCFRS